MSGVGRWMGVLDGSGDRRRGRGSFLGGVEFGASHRNQWGLCCIDVRQRRTLPKLLLETCCYISRQINFDLSVNKYQTAVDQF